MRRTVFFFRPASVAAAAAAAAVWPGPSGDQAASLNHEAMSEADAIRDGNEPGSATLPPHKSTRGFALPRDAQPLLEAAARAHGFRSRKWHRGPAPRELRPVAFLGEHFYNEEDIDRHHDFRHLSADEGRKFSDLAVQAALHSAAQRRGFRSCIWFRAPAGDRAAAAAGGGATAAFEASGTLRSAAEEPVTVDVGPRPTAFFNEEQFAVPPMPRLSRALFTTWERAWHGLPSPAARANALHELVATQIPPVVLSNQKAFFSIAYAVYDICFLEKKKLAPTNGAGSGGSAKEVETELDTLYFNAFRALIRRVPGAHDDGARAAQQWKEHQQRPVHRRAISTSRCIWQIAVACDAR